MSENVDRSDVKHREQTKGDTERGAAARVDELEAANADLRERVSELESIVAGIAPMAAAGEQLAQEPGGTGDAGDGDTPLVLPSGGQAHKVRGRFADSNGGVGVYGHNTADTGTTYGVWGEVDSPNGIGLYTPNEARIDGDVKTNGDVYMDPDGTDDFTDVTMGTNGRIYYNPDFGGVSIVGTADADEFRHTGGGGIVLESYGAYLKFADGSQQRTAGPVAKGVIDRSGTLVNGVGISSVGKGTSPPHYDISFQTIDYNNDDYVSIVTPLEPAIVETGTANTPGDLVVQFDDNSGSAISRKFHVVVFEATSGAATQSNSRTTEQGTQSSSSSSP